MVSKDARFRTLYPRRCSRSSPADPATSISFPTTLKIQSKTPLPQFTLMGVGVRTVSFLGIKVYSIGFYADLANPQLVVRPTMSIVYAIPKSLPDTQGRISGGKD